MPFSIRIKFQLTQLFSRTGVGKYIFLHRLKHRREGAMAVQKGDGSRCIKEKLLFYSDGALTKLELFVSSTS